MRYNWCLYEGSLVERLESAPKLSHSYGRRRKKGCLSVGPLKSNCGMVVSNASDMNELLTEAFYAVFVQVPPVSAQHHSFNGRLEEVYGSPESVVNVSSSLNSSSAAVPDGVHPHLLKACSAALSLPFYLLIVRSLDEEVLPGLLYFFCLFLCCCSVLHSGCPQHALLLAAIAIYICCPSRL